MTEEEQLEVQRTTARLTGDLVGLCFRTEKGRTRRVVSAARGRSEAIWYTVRHRQKAGSNFDYDDHFWPTDYILNNLVHDA